MFQIKTFSRQTDEIIMESESFPNLREAQEMMNSIGQGEGYYSILYRLEQVSLEDLAVS